MRSALLAIILAGCLIQPTPPEAGPTPQGTGDSSQNCLEMSPDTERGYQLKNQCSTCRTALIAWCDGVGHEFDVPGRGATHVPACPGQQSLVSDVPCQHGSH
jgi:hypothetical protein